MAAKKAQRDSGIANAVLKFFLDQKGEQEWALEEIAEEVGFTNTQVLGALQTIKRSYIIESPIRGWYIFKGAKNGSGEVGPEFNIVKQTSPGVYVLSGSDGKLYVARELEV